MARTTLKVPNVGSRLRDLRKESFGAFKIECVSADTLKKRKRVWGSRVTKKQTFYRLDLTSVDENKLKDFFRGLI
jgi:hypothetical protein